MFDALKRIIRNSQLYLIWNSHPSRVRPYMTESDILAIEKILLSYEKSGKIRIFEYGSGSSTLYFSMFLKKNNINFEWFAVDHVQEWVSFLAKAVSYRRLDSVFVQYKKIPHVDECQVNTAEYRLQFRETSGPLSLKEYTATIKEFPQEFDFVLVDGRDRKNCVRTALEKLAPQGVVVLHDAGRGYYRCLTDEFGERGSFVSKSMWILKKTDSSA